MTTDAGGAWAEAAGGQKEKSADSRAGTTWGCATPSASTLSSEELSIVTGIPPADVEKRATSVVPVKSRPANRGETATTEPLTRDRVCEPQRQAERR